nr:hypothetical protein CFP56_16542 [Quercus suber]
MSPFRDILLRCLPIALNICLLSREHPTMPSCLHAMLQAIRHGEIRPAKAYTGLHPRSLPKYLLHIDISKKLRPRSTPIQDTVKQSGYAGCTMSSQISAADLTAKLGDIEANRGMSGECHDRRSAEEFSEYYHKEYVRIRRPGSGRDRHDGVGPGSVRSEALLTNTQFSPSLLGHDTLTYVTGHVRDILLNDVTPKGFVSRQVYSSAERESPLVAPLCCALGRCSPLVVKLLWLSCRLAPGLLPSNPDPTYMWFQPLILDMQQGCPLPYVKLDLLRISTYSESSLRHVADIVTPEFSGLTGTIPSTKLYENDQEVPGCQHHEEENPSTLVRECTHSSHCKAWLANMLPSQLASLTFQIDLLHRANDCR